MPISPQITLIGNRSICAILFLPILPCPIHLLLDAALLQEIFLLPFDESLYQHVALVNQRNGNVGNGVNNVGNTIPVFELNYEKFTPCPARKNSLPREQVFRAIVA